MSAGSRTGPRPGAEDEAGPAPLEDDEDDLDEDDYNESFDEDFDESDLNEAVDFSSEGEQHFYDEAHNPPTAGGKERYEIEWELDLLPKHHQQNPQPKKQAPAPETNPKPSRKSRKGKNKKKQSRRNVEEENMEFEEEEQQQRTHRHRSRRHRRE